MLLHQQSIVIAMVIHIYMTFCIQQPDSHPGMDQAVLSISCSISLKKKVLQETKYLP